MYLWGDSRLMVAMTVWEGEPSIMRVECMVTADKEPVHSRASKRGRRSESVSACRTENIEVLVVVV